MERAAPAPEVPTVRQGTHWTLRSHHWDMKRVSHSSKESDAHQPGGPGEHFLEKGAPENWDWRE